MTAQNETILSSTTRREDLHRMRNFTYFISPLSLALFFNDESFFSPLSIFVVFIIEWMDSKELQQLVMWNMEWFKPREMSVQKLIFSLFSNSTQISSIGLSGWKETEEEITLLNSCGSLVEPNSNEKYSSYKIFIAITYENVYKKEKSLFLWNSLDLLVAGSFSDSLSPSLYYIIQQKQSFSNFLSVGMMLIRWSNVTKTIKQTNRKGINTEFSCVRANKEKS